MNDAQRSLLAAEAAFDQQDAILRDSLPEIMELKKRLQSQEVINPVDRRFTIAILDVIINKIVYQQIKGKLESQRNNSDDV